MYLKRMELFGFKSFADKSELGLTPGIAAVIGPNGCGKSNLVDAVRWALGEQSVKSLRGTKMEEIIFSGSDSRKALNFAEVSLTFEGAGPFLKLDYDEITITRRLFRNGDSEYYINKSPCRLKDITEMFMDTGLGKDLYSVIGQGRVDEVINSRPEERREIFEEAAGILKYKLRKKEARRRLDETRDNLIRVQDLIYELDTQIEPLHEQAEITKQYRLLQQQIETEEKKLLSFQLHQTREDLAKVNRQLDSVNDALFATAAQESQQEKERQDLKNNLLEQQKLRKEEEQNYNQLVRTYENLESELKLLAERENHIMGQLEQNKRRIAQFEKMMIDFQEQKEQTMQDLTHKKEELDQLNTGLEQSRAALTLHEQNQLAQEAEKMQEEIYKAGARNNAAEIALTESRKRLEKIAVQKNDLVLENQLLLSKLHTCVSNREEFEAKNNSLLSTLEKVRKQQQTEVEKEEHCKSALELGLAAVNKYRETLHGIKSRLQLLEEQDSALTGYYRGVREVLQARTGLPGIIGTIADLIKVESPYIQAVETALGGSLQYLVADSEKAVQDAIRFLKERNRGWATFLPLDILHQAADPLERYPGWRNLNGVIGKASELVSAKPVYRKAVDYLLSSVVVCRSLDDALKVAHFLKHSCRIVTLEGEMINPGGVIRGGSLPSRNDGMPLGRRREIEELTEKKTDQIKLLTAAENKLDELKRNLTEQQKLVTAKTDEIQEVTDQQRFLLKDLDKLQLEDSSLQQRVDANSAMLKSIEEEEAEIVARQMDLHAEIETCLTEIKTKENNLAEIKEDYRQYLVRKAEFEKRVTDLLVRISSCREQHEALNEKIADINININKPAAEKTETETEYEKHQRELADNEVKKLEINNEIEALNDKKAVSMFDLDRKNVLVSKLEAELIEFEEESRLRQGRINRQEKRERQLSLEQARMETEVNYQELHFRELFQTLELVDTEPDFEPEGCKQIVDNLREDAEALGEVNLGAIEELARLQDRINFLSEQKDDLHKGENSLKKVLAEIDQRMEFYFKEAFEQINENFKQTYSELFEGGQVLLKLTDQENILEAGVEISAQPPGKRLQNITLLSAGEKVLTAIALVFAILRYKPAPFYLLDEVESTLDDANLARFTKFLKQNARQAQFIMITHRRRTMEEAGVLYGVTMPEPGVSKLMSLKLEECLVGGENITK
ncbi:MAG: chromosome segregation protein SMC [Firmicutes bacterium]|nr:chromosome segregation protein SMC [Bacillota bacterium]